MKNNVFYHPDSIWDKIEFYADIILSVVIGLVLCVLALSYFDVLVK